MRVLAYPPTRAWNRLRFNNLWRTHGHRSGFVCSAYKYSNREKTFKFTGVEAPSIENGVLEVFTEETDDEESYSIADFRDWAYWRQVRSSHTETKIA